MRTILRFVLRMLFRFRAYNEEVLKTPGPVLLIPNHTSWFDWLLLGVCLEGDWKFVVSSVSAQTSWVHHKVMINSRTFPIDNTSPYAVKRMAEHLQANGRLVLFAEGRLSRTGTLMKLFQGTGFLLHKTNAKVITCDLRNANRLPYSPNPGLKQWFPRVTAHFSEVLTPPKCEHHSASQARNALTGWLHEKMVDQQFRVEMEFGPQNVLQAIVQSASERPRQRILEDASRAPITYRRLLTGAHALSGPVNSSLDMNASRVG
ncbi:MAG TPA: 1-acyl-sn-glycerol-3-phosphate acyltransferase, partial [Terriglobales bacterium]|nr:1-acyl-sn-glycerol-3-phosphate acyltransferase [Terriglobales bacterium]